MKEVISTKLAPKAIGPYSQAVKHGDMVYLSGQIPLNPETMEVVGGTAAEQAKQVMENLGEVLKAASSDFAKVIKCTIYLKDMNDFAAINEVYGSYFENNPPARATVEVARLPKDVLIEIDLIAHV